MSGDITQAADDSTFQNLRGLPFTEQVAWLKIMYIENKTELQNNRGRIGRVSFSKTGRRLSCDGKTFRSLKGRGCKANYYDVESGEQYWISGPRKSGGNRLYGTPGVDVDQDMREEYWLTIRNEPSSTKQTSA